MNEALRNAYDSANTGQRVLLCAFGRTRDTRALIAVLDFTTRALPQLDALRQQVPAASRPDVDKLIALLRQTRAALAGTIADCGRPCASIGALGPDGRLARTPTTRVPLTPAGGLRLPRLSTGGLPATGRAPAITGPGAVVGPAAPPLPVPTAATLPAVTVGPLIVKPSPIVVPPLPPLKSKAPALVVPPLPTSLPGLP